MPFDLLFGTPLFSCPGDFIAHYKTISTYIAYRNKNDGQIWIHGQLIPQDYVSIQCLESKLKVYSRCIDFCKYFKNLHPGCQKIPSSGTKPNEKFQNSYSLKKPYKNSSFAVVGELKHGTCPNNLTTISM